MTEQELNEKEAKNIDRVISSLKSILAFYKGKATPRRPLKSIRWALVVAIELCEKQIAKKPIEIKGLIFSLTKDGSEAHEIICECPNCRSRKLKRGFPCKCGQRIDWE